MKGKQRRRTCWTIKGFLLDFERSDHSTCLNGETSMSYDAYHGLAPSSITPSENCFPITPSDLESLPFLTKAIYIGRGGDLVLVIGNSQDAVTFRNVVQGSVLDVRVRAVKSTGTTAGDLVGLA